MGEPAFRARQLWHWIYHRGATDFAGMTTLAKSSAPGWPRVTSSRGPAPWRGNPSTAPANGCWFADGQEVETVHIPEEDRGTLCVSSQVGCTLTCRFCHTGTQRLVRNLSAAEILGQIMLARDALQEWPSPPDGRLISNIVMMGMGEPLYNYDNVAKALRIVMDGEGISISSARSPFRPPGWCR